MKAVTLPVSANKPNISVRCAGGARRAISARLADWAGPTKTPMNKAANQNIERSVASSATVPKTSRPTSATRIVGLLPRRSSMKAKPKAPMPAVTLSATPNMMISAVSMLKVPAA